MLEPIARGATAAYPRLYAAELQKLSGISREWEVNGIKRRLTDETWEPEAYTGIKAALIGETGLAEQVLQKVEQKYSGTPEFFDFDAAEIAVLLPDTTPAKSLLRRFEGKGSHAAALYIAVEIGETGSIIRLLEYISTYGVRAPNRGYLCMAVEALMKAVPFHPEFGKRVIVKVANERGVDGVEDPIEYLTYAAEIAAILGEKTYAKRAIERCLKAKKYMAAATISARLGEGSETENILLKVYKERENADKPCFDDIGFIHKLGYILGALAKYDPHTAERIFKTVENQAPKHLDSFAAKTLANLHSYSYNM
jgi:hypothetical protein